MATISEEENEVMEASTSTTADCTGQEQLLGSLCDQLEEHIRYFLGFDYEKVKLAKDVKILTEQLEQANIKLRNVEIELSLVKEDKLKAY